MLFLLLLLLLLLMLLLLLLVLMIVFAGSKDEGTDVQPKSEASISNPYWDGRICKWGLKREGRQVLLAPCLPVSEA